MKTISKVRATVIGVSTTVRGPNSFTSSNTAVPLKITSQSIDASISPLRGQLYLMRAISALWMKLHTSSAHSIASSAPARAALVQRLLLMRVTLGWPRTRELS